jgi:hypothetical protein
MLYAYDERYLMSPTTPGSTISARELIAVSGAPVAIPDPGHLLASPPTATDLDHRVSPLA